MTGENTDCHSEKVKTAPIYQMEGLRNGSSNLPDGSVPKGPAQSETYQLNS